MNYATELEVLIDAATIRRRIEELGAAITADYAGRKLVLLCVLKGSFVFAADLARSINLPLRVEFLGVRSYGDSTVSSGVVEITQDVARPIHDEDVLVVEDIVDTGLTCSFIMEQLRARRAHSVGLCSFLHKPARCKVPVPIDYLGFSIEDIFVVGYGLDAAQQFRNLPDLCVYRQS
jgi:hypoxanthine phosphoribosyltransferase